MIGKIYITGLIGCLDGEVGVELVDVISQVRKQPDATAFEVYIDSPGGVVDVGFDIYSYLTSLGLPITTIGRGMVASIATTIFMAGSKRMVAPNTEFMIHLPMGGASYVTADEMEDAAAVVRQAENKSIKFYCDQLNLSKEAITPLLKNETWLTPEQLLDLGFVTSQSEIKIAARAIIKNNSNNRNSNSRKMAKNSKLAAILNKLLGEVVVNKVIFSAEEKELVFPDLGEDDTIEVGATATYDGAPVGGTEDSPVEIVGQDGKTYVFVDSVLTEIREVVEEEEEVLNADLVEAFAETLEVMDEMSTEVDAMRAEITGMKTQRDDFKKKLDAATATIAKLKGSSRSPGVNPKDTTKEDSTTSAVAAWRASKKKNNVKSK